jgi:hypothetical protein
MATITDRQVITALAGGGRIVCDGSTGYDADSYRLVMSEVILNPSQVIRLMDEGWIRSSNTAYFLTDEGMKAHLRSVDELGDGRLLAPKPRG